jgi:hypothetical protein
MHHTQIWILVKKIRAYEDVTPIDLPWKPPFSPLGDKQTRGEGFLRILPLFIFSISRAIMGELCN